MAEIITLAAVSRKTAGKGTARAARREGRIPAVVYGNKVAPIMVTVDRRELEVQVQLPCRVTDRLVQQEEERMVDKPYRSAMDQILIRTVLDDENIGRVI